MDNIRATIILDCLVDYIEEENREFKRDYFNILYLADELERFFHLDIIRNKWGEIESYKDSENNFGLNNVFFFLSKWFNSWLSLSHSNINKNNLIEDHLLKIDREISIFKVPNNHFNFILDKFFFLGKLLYLLDKNLYFYFFKIKIPSSISLWFKEDFFDFEESEHDKIQQKIDEELRKSRITLKENLDNPQLIISDISNKLRDSGKNFFSFFNNLFFFDKNSSLEINECAVEKIYKKMLLKEKWISSLFIQADKEKKEIICSEKRSFNIFKYNMIFKEFVDKIAEISNEKKISSKSNFLLVNDNLSNCDEIDNNTNNQLSSLSNSDKKEKFLNFWEKIEKDNQEIILIIDDFFSFFEDEFFLSIEIKNDDCLDKKNNKINNFLKRLYKISIDLWVKDDLLISSLRKNINNNNLLILIFNFLKKDRYTDNLKLLSLIQEIFFFSDNLFIQFFYAKIILPKKNLSSIWSICHNFDIFSREFLLFAKKDISIEFLKENRIREIITSFTKNQEDAFYFFKKQSFFFKHEVNSLISLNLSRDIFEKFEEINRMKKDVNIHLKKENDNKHDWWEVNEIDNNQNHHQLNFNDNDIVNFDIINVNAQQQPQETRLFIQVNGFFLFPFLYLLFFTLISFSFFNFTFKKDAKRYRKNSLFS